MGSYFKKIIPFILLIFICTSSFFIVGCKYSGLMSLQEQIAIFENLGFNKVQSTDNVYELNQVCITINSIDDINNYLVNHNLNCSLKDLMLLYLQTQTNYLDSLIFVYTFDDTTSANIFLKHFNQQHTNCLFLYKNYVIQKGVNDYIFDGSKNYYYYTKFCSGLKQ